MCNDVIHVTTTPQLIWCARIELAKSTTRFRGSVIGYGLTSDKGEGAVLAYSKRRSTLPTGDLGMFSTNS